MRRLARELDVTPGALYWHFANKQELLGAVADEVLRPGGRSRPDQTAGASGSRDLAGRLRDALLSYTDGAELVSASFAAGQSAAMRRLLVELRGAAADAGLVAGQAELAARTVVYYVLGFTADEQSRLQWDAAGVNWPTGSRCCATRNDPDAAFQFGLTVLIRGLNVQGAAVQSHAETNVSAQEFE